MTRWKMLLFFVVLAIALTGCSGRDEAPAAATTQPTALPRVTATTPPTAEPTAVATDYCTECHTSEAMLRQAVDPAATTPASQSAESMGGTFTVVDPWKRVWVDPDRYPGSIHGLNGCTDCHGGVQSADKAAAHEGITRNPSKDSQKLCGECHPDVVSYAGTNLHMNQIGFENVVYRRGLPSTHAALSAAMQKDCTGCHVTCGECHVSRPTIAGGGFVDGHVFQRKPSMLENCVVCHGNRTGDEFLGKNEGQPADVHYSQAGMECTACHAGYQLHGRPDECRSCHPGPESAAMPPRDHRYSGIQQPRCESCHPNVSAAVDDNLYHQMHGAKLSCQVCHSVEYTNCQGCHAAGNPQAGEAGFTLDGKFLGFMIGKNTNNSYERPYTYVPVRHIPVTVDTFAAFGANLMPNFDKEPTWKYATPHNIQLRTPQTASCNACHGNSAIFLTADKLAAEELNANLGVIVDSPPPPISADTKIP